jgi:hypothetical protein
VKRFLTRPVPSEYRYEARISFGQNLAAEGRNTRFLLFVDEKIPGLVA